MCIFRVGYLQHLYSSVRASVMCLPPEKHRGSTLTKNSMHSCIKQNKLYLYFHTVKLHKMLQPNAIRLYTCFYSEHLTFTC